MDMTAIVLIETLWNVKCQDMSIAGHQGKVLIETLWNVKGVRLVPRMHPRRFNRNIVECKVKSFTNAATRALVLIETLWNVKCYDLIDDYDLIVVLIETLWNVKIATQGNFSKS